MTQFTRDALAGIYSAIVELQKDNLNKFALFALDKNRSKLLEVINEISEKETAIYTDEYKKFAADRVATVKKYAVKDDNGEVVVENNNATINPEFVDEAGEALKELEAKYAETLKTYSKDIEEFTAYVSEKIDFEFSKIAFKNIPDNLSPKEFALFKLLLKETEEELEEVLG